MFWVEMLFHPIIFFCYKYVQLALSNSLSCDGMQVGEHSEHLQIGFLSYKVARNARQQVCTDLIIHAQKERVIKIKVQKISDFLIYLMCF